MPKVTEVHLETRRQQILDAAILCFSRQGFHQTTMQDICREAELSPGAVYRYFQSKEEIIKTVCEGCRQIDQSLIESAAQNDGTLAVLDELASMAFGDLDQDEADPRLRVTVQLWSEAMRSPDIRNDLCLPDIELWKSSLAQIVGAAQQKGEINAALDPQAVARVPLATWQGLVLQKALQPDTDVSSYVEVVRAMYSGRFWRDGQGTAPG